MAKVSAEIEILCTYFGGLQLHFREFFLDYLGIDTSFVGNDTENPEISYSMELYLQTFYRKRHCASVRIDSFSGPYFLPYSDWIRRDWEIPGTLMFFMSISGAVIQMLFWKTAVINTFQVPIFYALIAPENQMFSGVFSGYNMGILTRDGLNCSSIKNSNSWMILVSRYIKEKTLHWYF